jgi:large subunit ribosomal protein L25
MASVQIAVEPRLVTGKKVKSLRRQGIIPAHLYGRGTDSLALQATASTVGTLLRTAERNQIIDLKIGGEPQARPVMLRGVQRNPITDELVHIDFFQISLTEKLSADVPLNIIGEAPAVHIFGGILLHAVNHVTVEALPADLPGHIDVDVSSLDTLEAALHVRDITLPPNVEMLTDPDQVIAKVSPPRVEVVEEVAPTEEALAAAAAAAAAAGEEGAPAADATKEPAESE